MTQGQDFIGRNREPRVQIVTELETNGALPRKELPFVMAVLADLVGKTIDTVAAPGKRKFQDIDIDTFGAALAAMRPSVAFPVKNTLTGEDNLTVKLEFKSMDDFGPGAIAHNVPELAELLAVRKELDRLKLMLDGKGQAVARLQEALKNPALLRALAAAGPEDAGPASGEGENALAPADQ